MLKHLLRGGGSGIQGDPWVATFGSSGYEWGKSVAVAPDGSIYVCGYTNTSGSVPSELLLAKFSSSGTVQWQKTLGSSSGSVEGYSVAVAPDGSVYVCGVFYSNLLLAKFSSSGTVQWQKTLGNSNYEYGYSVAVAPDGSVYVCGYMQVAGTRYYDLILAKFSSSGTVQWQKTFGSSDSSNYELGQSVAVAPDGSVYVCGYTTSVSDYNDNFLLAKFSSSGTVQWQKKFDSGAGDRGLSVAVAPDGSVYVCGYINNGNNKNDLFLAKFSSSGTVQWKKTLGGSYGYSVAVAPDGSVYVCGYTYPAGGAGGYDLLLAKFSSSGTVQWQKTFGNSSHDYCYSVAVAPDGSVYVCGYTTSGSAGNYDLLLAKITDFLVEKDIVTIGDFTFQDISLTAKNVSLTSTSISFSASDAGFTVTTPSLTVGTSSFTTNLYTL